MSDIGAGIHNLDSYRKKAIGITESTHLALKSGGGGGTFDGMEGRVAKLETLMDVVRTDVGALKSDVRDVRDRLIRLEEKVAHLPSKGFIVTAITTALALITAITLFQGKIQSLLNIPN